MSERVWVSLLFLGLLGGLVAGLSFPDAASATGNSWPWSLHQHFSNCRAGFGVANPAVSSTPGFCVCIHPNAEPPHPNCATETDIQQCVAWLDWIGDPPPNYQNGASFSPETLLGNGKCLNLATYGGVPSDFGGTKAFRESDKSFWQIGSLPSTLFAGPSHLCVQKGFNWGFELAEYPANPVYGNHDTFFTGGTSMTGTVVPKYRNSLTGNLFSDPCYTTTRQYRTGYCVIRTAALITASVLSDNLQPFNKTTPSSVGCVNPAADGTASDRTFMNCPAVWKCGTCIQGRWNPAGNCDMICDCGGNACNATTGACGCTSFNQPGGYGGPSIDSCPYKCPTGAIARMRSGDFPCDCSAGRTQESLCRNCTDANKAPSEDGVSCLACTRAAQCNGHGNCLWFIGGNPVCACDEFYTGPTCGNCVSGYINDNGVCRPEVRCAGRQVSDGQGGCYCPPNFVSPNCTSCAPGFYMVFRGQQPYRLYGRAGDTESAADICVDCGANALPNNPAYDPSKGVCNGRGVCSFFEGTGTGCNCTAGTGGRVCELTRALNCSNQGNPPKFPDTGLCVCHNATTMDASTNCKCRQFYHGTNCTTYCGPSCDDPFGTCNATTGQCMCSGNFAGPTCHNCKPDTYYDSTGGGACFACLNGTTCNMGGYCKTSGGTASTPCTCYPGFAGTTCSLCASGFYGPSCLPCPADQFPTARGVCSVLQTSSTCSDGKGGTGKCSCINGYQGTACNDPKFSATAVPLSTSGDTAITISGAYFLKPGGLLVQVRMMGESPVPCVGTINNEDGQCTHGPLQPRTGGYVDVMVERSDGRTGNFTLAYPGPTATISPLNGPTSGGITMVLTGLNLGLKPVVTFGNPMVLTSANGKTTSFTLPAYTPGIGRNPTILLSVAGQSSMVTSFQYDAPTISNVTTDPSPAPTNGSYSMTVRGDNFGQTGPVTVLIGGSNAGTATYRDDHTIVVPGVVGAGETAYAIAVSTYALVNFASGVFYAGPRISTVTGCPGAASGSGDTGCASTGQIITIDGDNFGADYLTLTITADYGSGDAAVSAVSMPILHRRLVCTLPNNGFGLFKVLKVARGTQVSSGAFLSFAGPVLTPGSLKLAASASARSDIVVGTQTSAGEKVSFLGSGFGSSVGSIVVNYGTLLEPQRYICTGIAIPVADVEITCDMARGVGGPYNFTVVRNGNSQSAPSTFTFSYPGPDVLSASLRQQGTSMPGFAIYQDGNPAGEGMMLNGTNLGFEPSQVAVALMPGGIFCDVLAATGNSVSFRTPPGTGSGFTVRVTVAGSVPSSDTSDDVYSYQSAVPTVTAVSGCPTPDGAKTAGCPTQGYTDAAPVWLTVTGSSFTNTSSVRLGDVLCDKRKIGPGGTLLVRLPAGVGLGRLLTVREKSKVSTAVNFVSYAAPTVTSVMGGLCGWAMPAGVHAIDCARTGSSFTVVGANFGSERATVLIDGDACTSVVHDPATPHSRLYCALPAGIGANKLVTVIQYQGQVSVNNVVTVSYQVCAPGTFSNGTQCSKCPQGSYSADGTQTACTVCPAGKYGFKIGGRNCEDCLPGKASSTPNTKGACATCPAGSYSNAWGSLTCTACPVGSMSINSQSTSCQQCSVGRYQASEGGSSCDACPAGSFQDVAQSGFCKKCPYGTFTDYAGSSYCYDCPVGRVGTSLSATNCSACASGTISATPAQSQCSDCPPGAYSKSGDSVCSSCVPGKFSDSAASTVCTACVSGRFASVFGSVQCFDCAPGSFYNPQYPGSSPSVCRPCPRGNYSTNAGASNCTACLPGTYSDEGQSQCTACPTGRVSTSTAATTCTLCAVGSTTGAGSTLCTACAAGKYHVMAGDQCHDCPSGRFSTPGSSTCTMCAGGKYALAGDTSCTSCAVNYVAPAGSVAVAACTLCQPGRFSNVTNCVPCPPGTDKSNPSLRNCVPCLLGRVAPFAGTAQCTECPAGKMAVAPNQPCALCAAGRAGVNCELCNSDQSNLVYSDARGLTACKTCEVGKRANQDRLGLTCEDCPIGTYGSGCTPCTEGNQCFQTGQSSQFPCPAGTESSADKTYCAYCAPGRAKLGNPNCEMCEAGKYAQFARSISCTQCPTGKFQPDIGQSACIDCIPGKYQPSPGGTQCSLCQGGFSCPLPGLAAGVLCSGGSYAPAGASNCSLCDPGYFVAPGQISLICAPCGNGTSSLAGASMCTACLEGKYASGEGNPTCVPCAKGYYQSQVRQTKCNACTPGRAAAQTGTIDCAVCQPGTFAAGLGANNCTDCPAGSYQPSVGQSACLPCVNGTYNPSPRQTACLACGFGSFTNTTGRTVCVSCARGSHQNATGRTQCDLCEVGFFASGNAQRNCQPCLSGTYGAYRGVTDCVACDPGQFQNEDGQLTCLACPEGTYSQLSRSLTCDDCPLGQFSNTSGLSVCFNCPVGFEKPVRNQNQSTAACTPCRNGTYTGTEGSPKCLECEVGKYTNLTKSTECLPCPPGSTTEGKGGTGCIPCKPGTAGSPCLKCPVNTVAPEPGALVCIPCRDSTSIDNLVCRCPEGRYSSGNVDGSIQCEPCPDGADCSTSGVTIDDMRTAPGWWRVSNDTLTYFRCRVFYYCLGGAAAGSAQCFGNRDGPLCQLCRDGYQELADKSCGVCPPTPAVSWVVFVVVISLVAMFLVVMYWVVLRNDQYLILAVKEAQEQAFAASQGSPVKPSVLTAGLKTLRSETTAGQSRGVRSETDRQLGMGLAMVQNRKDTHLVRAERAMTGLGAYLAQDQLMLEGDEKSSISEDGFNRQAGNGLAMNPNLGDDELVTYDRRSKREIANMTHQLKILVSFFQIITQLAFNLSVPWPSVYHRFIGFFNLIHLDFTQWAGASCVINYDYYVSFIISVSVPMVILVCLLLFFVLPRYLRIYVCADPSHTPGFKTAQMKRVMTKFVKLILFTSFLIFPRVSAAVLRLYVCQDIGGVDYLVADFSVQCHTDKWNAYAMFNILTIVLYPVGIPLFFFYKLFSNRHRFAVLRVRYEMGFLYEAYETDVWWFELVDMTHKIILTALIGFLSQEFQLPTGMVIATLYLMVILMRKPYYRRSDDRLIQLGQIDLLLFMMAGRVFIDTNETLDSTADVFMSIFLILMTVGFILVFARHVVSILFVLWRRFRSAKSAGVPLELAVNVAAPSLQSKEPAERERAAKAAGIAPADLPPLLPKDDDDDETHETGGGSEKGYHDRDLSRDLAQHLSEIDSDMRHRTNGL